MSSVLKQKKRNASKGSEINLNTIVIEKTEEGDMPIDVYQKLANDRILFITDIIDTTVASEITATLLLKDAENPDEKITLFINSEGGNIRDVLMIYDTMNMISAPIETICIGSAMDEIVVLLAGGTPGMRFATKNSTVSTSQLVHDWMARVNMTDARKYLEMCIADNKKMMSIIAKGAGITLKQAMSDFERRLFMTAAQAKKYGIIDKVIG